MKSHSHPSHILRVSPSNGLDISLPIEVMRYLQVHEGEYVTIEVVDQALQIVRTDEELQNQLAIAHQVMVDNHEVLKRLADS
ncbi:hypothetical protein PLANPX_0029 [Lacipirellula parvula]|uniref:SpoVT-AbrB domain-containing protein n=2 Tax=Lacipirellula parvula TaxID=2650471 RepID=A0A5K7X3N9_9BACT|nr:hypothetical protein PLANPX_0029 [Lacipirellula parvula]